MALILIAFPRQEWLSELAYTYIACLVYSPFPTCSASSSFLPSCHSSYIQQGHRANNTPKKAAESSSWQLIQAYSTSRPITL